MKTNQSKLHLFFIPLLVVVIVGVALGVVWYMRMHKAPDIKVSPTSPKEVGDAYRAELRTLLTDTKALTTCDEQVKKTTDTIQTMRVPKENRDAHLQVFLSFTNNPLSGASSCAPQIETRLTPLLTAPEL